MGHYIANKLNSKLLSEVYLIFEPLFKNFRIEFGLESPLKWELFCTQRNSVWRFAQMLCSKLQLEFVSISHIICVNYTQNRCYSHRKTQVFVSHYIWKIEHKSVWVLCESLISLSLKSKITRRFAYINTQFKWN
jgi:hypothetical protein